MPTDFAARPVLQRLRELDAQIAKRDQLMQRAKFSDRKQRTRKLILIGAAVERAGADDLDPDEIAAVLAHYIASGGEAGLKAHVVRELRQAKGGSAATRRDAGEDADAVSVGVARS